jgi:predicted DCC family thiol-disulfide oxidoreductase YuxK
MSGIILFDGVCNLCSSVVQFVIKRDKKGHFQFASLQSEAGQSLLDEYEVDRKTDSFILIENGNCYMKSSAALKVAKNLDGLWKIVTIGLVIPKPLRDFIYDIIARNRYKWFGKKDSCMLPPPSIKKRFIE